MLRPPCMKYIHFLGLYRPFDANLSALYDSLLDADSNLVDQCMIDVWQGIQDVSMDRGVSPRLVSKEFKGILKSLPNAQQLSNMSRKKAIRTLLASHRNADFNTSDMLASTSSSARDTVFSGTGWLFTS